MKKLSIFIVISFGLVTCRKDEDKGPHDLSGNKTVQGVVVLYDTLSATYNYTLGKAVDIFIRDAASPTAYLTITKTDTQGKYLFNGIDSNISYTVYASIDTGAVKYYGEINYPAKSIHNFQTDTLKLWPSQTNQNGMDIRTLDSLYGPLPNINIYVFSSKAKWLVSDSVGNSFQLKSNIWGRALKMNVAPEWYYLTAIDSVGKMIIKAKDSVQVNPQGIKAKTLRLLHG